VGLRGMMRGKRVGSTATDAKAPSPRDRANRALRAEQPTQRWGSDFASVSTWQGFVYVAFVIAVCSRPGQRKGERVHRSDHGSQYSSILYTERLAEAIFGACWETSRAVRWRIERRDGRPMGIAGLWPGGATAPAARSACPPPCSPSTPAAMR
jgi:transposase InsO family protein